MDYYAFVVVSQNFKINKTKIELILLSFIFRIVTGGSLKFFSLVVKICAYELTEFSLKKELKTKIRVNYCNFKKYVIESYESCFNIKNILNLSNYINSTHIYMYDAGYPCEILQTENGYIYFNNNMIELSEKKDKIFSYSQRLEKFLEKNNCEIVMRKRKSQNAIISYWLNKNEIWEIEIDKFIPTYELFLWWKNENIFEKPNFEYIKKFTQEMNKLSQKYLETRYKEKNTYWYLESFRPSNRTILIKGCKISHLKDEIIIESTYKNIFNVLAIVALKCVSEDNEPAIVNKITIKTPLAETNIEGLAFLEMHEAVLIENKKTSKLAPLSAHIKLYTDDHKEYAHLLPYAEDETSSKDEARMKVLKQL